MSRLIPFPVFDRPGRACVPAAFFALALAAALLIPAAARAEADDDHFRKAPAHAPARPANTGEFLKRCRDEALYCDEQFAAYIQRYAAVWVDELAQRPEYRLLRRNLSDPGAFDGICLPRERLLSDDFLVEIQRGFRRWAEQHPERHGERVPAGVKAAMQALYPCKLPPLSP
ncbi:MAG: hypothetical protein ACT4N4_18315 [Rhodospirillales bacterium]